MQVLVKPLQNAVIQPAGLEPLLSENCKGLTKKLEVKYLFPTSYSGASFFAYELFEGLQVRKILADVIGMQQNPQIRARVCWICGTIIES